MINILNVSEIWSDLDVPADAFVDKKRTYGSSLRLSIAGDMFGAIGAEKAPFTAKLMNGETVVGYITFESLGKFKGQEIYQATKLYPEGSQPPTAKLVTLAGP